MRDPGVAWAKSLHAELVANASTLGVASSLIFDHVPQDTKVFPYLCIGECTAVDDGDKQDNAQVIDQSIIVLSRYQGRLEAREILDKVYDLIHEREDLFAVAGFQVVNIRHTRTVVLLDGDGRTYRGVASYRVNLNHSGN